MLRHGPVVLVTGEYQGVGVVGVWGHLMQDALHRVGDRYDVLAPRLVSGSGDDDAGEIVFWVLTALIRGGLRIVSFCIFRDAIENLIPTEFTDLDLTKPTKDGQHQSPGHNR